jgi:transcriptional regulator GlxA family with amidase domain
MISENHYSVEQLAEQWNVSRDTVRRMFLDEPGVLVIARPTKKYRRPHRTLRIPQSVAERVYRRLQNAA